MWLWFRSPHCELAAGMMRTSEPPHEQQSLANGPLTPTFANVPPKWDANVGVGPLVCRPRSLSTGFGSADCPIRFSNSQAAWVATVLMRLRIPAARLRPSFARHHPRKKKGAGNAGRQPHPQPCVRMEEAHKQVTTGQPLSPAFPARWFATYSVLSPVRPGFVVTVASRKIRKAWHLHRGG